MTSPGPVTARVAAYAVAARETGLPPAVMHEAWRCLLNFLGCALGGGTHDAVRIVDRALAAMAGAGRASVIGQSRSVDPLHAALVNGTAASAHSFDDTHAEAIVHPGAPVGAAALAVAQQEGMRGSDLLAALALGAEIACRASKAISVAPATGDIAWYQTGVCGGIGAAVAAGTLMRLDAAQIARAIGVAAAQASGTRIFQGSMTMLLLAGHAAECGVKAALLARAGLDSPSDAIEGRYGFAEVHARSPHHEHLVDGLGTRFELLSNTYKAYPCGVVLHPVVDACLALRAQMTDPLRIREVRIRLHPVALALTDRRHPPDRTAAQVSLHHWASVALLRGRASLAEGEPAAIADPAIAGMRDRIHPVADESRARDEVDVTLVLDTGETLTSPRFRGVAPMPDLALEQKFSALAGLVFPPARVDDLLAAVRDVPAASTLDRLAVLL